MRQLMSLVTRVFPSRSNEFPHDDAKTVKSPEVKPCVIEVGVAGSR